MRHTAKYISSTIIASALFTTPALAQSILGDMLRGGLERATNGAAEDRTRSDRIRKQAFDRLRANPDSFCSESAPTAARIWGNFIGQGDVYPAAQSLVGRNKSEPQTANGYDAMLQGMRSENARRQAERSGSAIPVAHQEVKAEEFSDETQVVLCRARVDVDGLLAGYVRWDIGLGLAPNPAKALLNNPSLGWYLKEVRGPQNTLAYARENPTQINVTYGGKDLSWDEAVAEVERERIALAQQQAERARRAAYESSPAGRADAARKRAALVAEEVRLQRQELPRRRACEASGGTWGWVDASRQFIERPSCFFQTVRN